MRKFTILTIIAMSLLTYSCDKHPKNGKLDGMWQIMTVNFNRGGAYDSLVNIKDQRAYLSFQLDLAQIVCNKLKLPETNTVISRFKHEGGALTFYDFYYHYRTKDSLFTGPDTLVLTSIGFIGKEQTFHVMKLTDEAMELQSSYSHITLRKF